MKETKPTIGIKQKQTQIQNADRWATDGEGEVGEKDQVLGDGQKGGLWGARKEWNR